MRTKEVVVLPYDKNWKLTQQHCTVLDKDWLLWKKEKKYD